MAKKKRHSIGSPSPPSHFTPRGRRPRFSRTEIASKLTQANDLATQGKLQREIARRLDVSVNTLHRWRKASPVPRPALVATHEAGNPDRLRRGGDRIAELQLENSRLRRLVIDLLLEKIRLEEVVQSYKSRTNLTRS